VAFRIVKDRRVFLTHSHHQPTPCFTRYSLVTATTHIMPGSQGHLDVLHHTKSTTRFYISMLSLRKASSFASEAKTVTAPVHVGRLEGNPYSYSAIVEAGNRIAPLVAKEYHSAARWPAKPPIGLSRCLEPPLKNGKGL
jgi:hypothetical protein